MSDSHELHKEQCPQCAAKGNDTSEDNLSVYSDGHVYCHSCEYFANGDGEAAEEEVYEKPFDILNGRCVAIPTRKIKEKTCQKFRYEVAKDEFGTWQQVANYYVENKLVAQHTRTQSKQFRWRGNTNGVELFGQHLWRDSGGKRLIITEGELDAMSMAQVLGLTWPVVSIPSGNKSAVKSVKQNLEFVLSYDEIVLCMDQDEAGAEAVSDLCQLLPPGRVKVMSLPLNDANAMLMDGREAELKTAMWDAQVYSPDEILHVSQVIEASEEAEQEMEVYPFPFDILSEFLIGQRSGEITLYCSGTGSGKSVFMRELMIDHLLAGRSVGCIMLEESPQETMEDLTSLILNKPVRAIRAGRMMNELRVKMGKDPIVMEVIDDLTDAEYADAKRQLKQTNLYIYDHLGQNAMSCLMNRMEYMAVSLGVDVIILDHITAAAAGLMGIKDKDTGGGGQERLLIDNLMKDLRSLAVRTGVHVDIVSQLKKTEKAYEEGARITLQDLRGSGALASVPNTVVSLERDRQAEDVVEANTTTVRVLKNRLTGRAGIASYLYYDHGTSRMTEVVRDFNNSGADFEAIE